MIITKDKLLQLIKEIKMFKSMKIVTTNGCFDILHRGHIELLKEAASFGDWLIVCINSDKSVRKLKGPSRPINNADDRAYMLSAIKGVDYVVIFDDLTPVRLLGRIRPDIHIKGGDYKAKDLPEAKVVKKHGGKIKILPLTVGYSTTNLLKRNSQNDPRK